LNCAKKRREKRRENGIPHHTYPTMTITNAFELERAARIEANKARMAAMGITTLASNLAAVAAVAKKTQVRCDVSAVFALVPIARVFRRAFARDYVSRMTHALIAY
jgi:hypothetical protein